MLIDRRRIAGLIPHSGSMCLLDAALRWDGDGIECTATSHRLPDNPLRRDGRLAAVCALEYAAQAMALHGALTAPELNTGALTAPELNTGALTAPGVAGTGKRSRGGLLAATRDLVLHRERLDDAGATLTIEARRVLGEASRVIYEFRVGDVRGAIAEGRAAVVLEA